MKNAFSFLFSLFNLILGLVANAQEISPSESRKAPFFIPQNTSFNANTNFHWFFNQGFHSKWVDKIYIYANLKYTRNTQIVFVNRINLVNNSLQNKFTEIYFNYYKFFRKNPQFFLYRYGTYLNLKMGMSEWYPSFTNVRLMFENAEKYFNPDRVYGGSIVSITPLTSDRALTIHIGAHSGDLIYHKADPQLYDLYVNYTKIYKYGLGVSAQSGIAYGSRHVVNFAHILYRPKFESMQLDIQFGKLPSIDETPYGIHLGIKRKFKYFALGGYYERRLNQNRTGEIVGISYSVLAPPKLAKFINEFMVVYDFNSNAIWMWIPILKIDIDNQ